MWLGGAGGRAGYARQVRKTWQLKHLTRLEVIDGEAGEASPAALELCFVNNAFTSEARLALRAEAPAALTDLLGALFLFCRRARARTLPAGRCGSSIWAVAVCVVQHCCRGMRCCTAPAQPHSLPALPMHFHDSHVHASVLCTA